MPVLGYRGSVSDLSGDDPAAAFAAAVKLLRSGRPDKQRGMEKQSAEALEAAAARRGAASPYARHRDPRAAVAGGAGPSSQCKQQQQQQQTTTTTTTTTTTAAAGGGLCGGHRLRQIAGQHPDLFRLQEGTKPEDVSMGTNIHASQPSFYS